jgi:tol-pal system protein YbgF
MNRLKLLACVALGALTIAADVAAAQPLPPQGPPVIEWDKRRLDRLERNLRRLDRQLNQNAEVGNPPILLEPDPETVALQGQVADLTQRLGDMEATLQRLNGQLETTTFELQQARDAQTAAQAQVEPLRTKVAELEGRLAALEQAGAAAAGSEDAPAPAPTGSSASDFEAAMQLMLDGQLAQAASAFTAFLERWPNAAEAPEARFRLAETYFSRDDFAGAATNYALALRGWPKSRWAADATVKLATSLNALQRTTQACAALGEFERRYAAGAAATVRTRATALKTRAKCA